MIKRACIVALAMMAATPGAGWAQAKAPGVSSGPSEMCAKLGAAIESDQKELAVIEVEGLGDDSAPRATMRATRQVALFNEISANINLMQAHRCAPYGSVISASRYLVPALNCSTARLKAINSGARGDVSPAECERANWSPK